MPEIISPLARGDFFAIMEEPSIYNISADEN
jgi:hypothetical protein